MNLANKISIFRIFLAPAIIASLVYYNPGHDGLRFLALGLFLVGIVSDAADGLIARLYRQQTELGALLDPIADKLLILSTLISCSVIHGLPTWMRIPAWFNLIVISRDAIILTGTAVLFGIRGRQPIKPTWLGKCTTASQMLVIPAVLLGLPLKMPLIAVAAVLTVLSGIGYVRMGIRALA